MSESSSRAAELLKKKAMLLLRREEELFVLRQERARSETWLEIFHGLSLAIGSAADDLMKRWTGLLTGRLSYQAAGVYRRENTSGDLVAESREPVERLGARVELDAELGELLRTCPSGRHDPSGSSPAVRSLARQLRLDKFYWLRHAAHGDELLMVAGFSTDGASFHRLSDSDQGNFEMFSNHLGTLVDNVALLTRLGAERGELRRSNLELDESLRVLRQTQQKLVEVSRASGMAEIATAVLHDLGNSLNSVNVSAALVGEKARKLDTHRLSAAVQLMESHRGDLGRFLETDARGTVLVPYLRLIADALADRRQELVNEVRLLQEHVENTKVVIGRQEVHAGPKLVIQRCDVRLLVGDAVAAVASSYAENRIELVVEHGDLPEVSVDRDRVVQILQNLLTNAGHAVVEGRPGGRRVTVCTRVDGDLFSIALTDNGVGIAGQHLQLVFAPGFTTCKDRRGFGLHDSSLSARSMDGQLRCFSPGPGQGAVFTLELPLRPRVAGQPSPPMAR